MNQREMEKWIWDAIWGHMVGAGFDFFEDEIVKTPADSRRFERAMKRVIDIIELKGNPGD